MDTNLKKLLKKVSYRKNIIFIEFNKNMNIDTKKVNRAHSYLNFINYAIENGEKIKPFPVGTKSDEVEIGLSARFSLPNSFLENIYDDCVLHLGYVDRRKIFYIESADGDIPNICSTAFLGKEVEELNLQNGKITIIDKNTLKYSYNGENRFKSLWKEDFHISKQGKVYYPIDIKQINSKEFYLIFSNGILNQINLSIFLKVVSKPISNDLYGFNIKGNVETSLLPLLPTELISFNFVYYEDKIAYFKLKFSKPIKNFNSTDFMIKYNNASPKFINYFAINNDKTIVDIYVSNMEISDIDNSVFEIFTVVGLEQVHTIDNEDNIVFIKSKMTSNLFRSSKISWLLRDYNFSNSIISIEFNNNILSKSLITDYSIFNEPISTWNGERLSIKPGNLKVGYIEDTITKEKKLTLYIYNNDKFGKIIIKEKQGFKPIRINEISNTKMCYIYIQDNKLFLEFDEKEDMDGILVFIEKIKYYPSNLIKNLIEDYIYYGYNPIGNYTLGNLVYIEPLNDILDNPFKGENVFTNYILGIHDNNKIRDYGNELNKTEINGFLRVVGRLQDGEVANLQNLKVLGTIIIDASKTSVTLKKVECFGDAEFKAH